MRDMVQAIRAVRDTQTAQLAPSQYDEKAAVMRDMVQAIRAVRDAQTAQLAPSHFDDSIEAPQVAATMRAMAAIHVPSMEAIRLAMASAKAAAEEKSQEARLQDPTLATPAQTADLAPSHYDSLGDLTSAQARALGLPALAGIKEMAEERYLTAILQNPTLLALVQAEEAVAVAARGPNRRRTGKTGKRRVAARSRERSRPLKRRSKAAEAAHNPGVSMLQVLP